MKCLKMNKKKFDQNEGWDCPICDWRKEIPRTSTRPSLTELREWVTAAETLPFCPDELPIVRKNIALAETWVASIEPIVQKKDPCSLSKCRFYLRKIEGAEVFLPFQYNFFRQTAHALAPLTSTPPPLVAESRVVKKSRSKKPKSENIITLPERDSSNPRFSIRGPYEGHPVEQRILPAHRIDPMSMEQPRPQTCLSRPYVPSMPPKGTFAPPQIVSPSYRTEERRSQSIDRIPPVCGSCKSPFVPGTHNEPLACSQCQKLHHTVCIGKYGGRLYPAFVW
jgi:hypothetical protein